MANPHHRKKHKSHVQNFKHSHDTTTGTGKAAKRKGANIFAIVGAVLGLAISYFIVPGEIVWIITGLTIGAVAGYVAGKQIDKG